MLKPRWQLLFFFLGFIVQLNLSGFAMSQASDVIDKHELVLAGGRVIDPETGLDAIRNVGISSGRIQAISEFELAGDEVVDVEGLVVSPGFIDMHSHGAFSVANQVYQLHDGVTTALELEAGGLNIKGSAARLENAAFINYGASASYANARLLVLDGLVNTGLSGERGDYVGARGLLSLLKHKLGWDLRVTSDQAADAEVDAILDLLDKEVKRGAIGVGLPLDYMSQGVARGEVERLFQWASTRNQMVFVHIRRMPEAGDPAGLLEIVDIAERTGAAVHICHITASATKNIDGFLELVTEARRRGVDISIEAYPYTAGSTFLGARVFDQDWKTAFGISYDDIEYPATGERLTKERFLELRNDNPEAVVVHHYNREEWVEQALAFEITIIASDAMYKAEADTKVHPRSAGTFSRVLGRYVREKGIMSLADAIEKMTLMPAQRLETMAPAFRRKGRVQVGMDADIVVFDPESIEDRATYGEPSQYSRGVEYVLVGGKFALQKTMHTQGKTASDWVQSGKESK